MALGANRSIGAVFSFARDVAQLRRLPRPARTFYRSALWTAIRACDGYTLRVSLPPRELAGLLELAADRPRIVELGTANAWTALALAVNRPDSTVLTLDPTVRPERQGYIGLVAPDVRSRITFLQRGGEEPAEPGEIDLLYIDTTHEYDLVLACFERWMPLVVAGGLVVFDDYAHPRLLGTGRAVRELGLSGSRLGRMFVWTKP